LQVRRLKLISRKRDVRVWTELIWNKKEPILSVFREGISSLAEQLFFLRRAKSQGKYQQDTSIIPLPLPFNSFAIMFKR
jgi:hypothetical protein